MTYSNIQTEYIRLDNKGTEEETVTRILVDEVDDSMEAVKPVFDEFRKVFILTRGTESFYMDMEGNYDTSCGMQIEWSSAPSLVTIARPYLIAFMDASSTIEIKPLAHAKSKS